MDELIAAINALSGAGFKIVSAEPFGYYDHFNDVLYRGEGAKAQADAAMAGENLVTPLYRESEPT